MNKFEVSENDRVDDPLGFNDNDSDKTDFNQSALKESEAKIERLTTLLAKLKKALEVQTAKTNEKTKEVEKLSKEKKELEEVVENFFKEENNQHSSNLISGGYLTFFVCLVDWKIVQDIPARVVINSTVWCCMKTDSAIVWKREESISTSAEDSQQYSKFTKPKVLDYFEAFKKNDEDKKKISELEAQMMEVVRQYEERLQKLRGVLEETESKSKSVIQELKTKQQDGESISSLLSLVINESAEIRENNLIYLNEESDNSTKEEAIGKVKILLHNLKKREMSSDHLILNEIRNHLLLLHETLFDSLKRLSMAESDIFQAEKNWKKTIDNMIHEIEKEKKESNQAFKFYILKLTPLPNSENDLVDLGRKKMKDLESTIETMRMEAQKGIKERDLQIEFLGKELKKNANVQYIKNILINFLTNPDYTVREKVIPVLGTVCSSVLQSLRL